MNNQLMNYNFPSNQEVMQLMEVCKVLAASPFYQKLGPGGVLGIYLTARELNLPVMMCLNGGMYNIDGKVSLSSQLINMMLVNAGWEIRFDRLDDEACELTFISPKKVENKFSYTVEEAKKAGYFGRTKIINGQEVIIDKPKNNWINHTKDMLFARCIASGGRKFAPNVLGSCYGQGELDNDTSVVIENDSLKNTLAIENSITSFKEKYQITDQSDYGKFVKAMAKKAEKDEEYILKYAVNNEEKFNDSFKKWSLAIPSE